MNLTCRLPALALLMFIVVTTLGVFVGGVWAGAAFAGGVLLFAGVWALNAAAPEPAPRFAQPLRAAAVIAGFAGLGALLYFAPVLLRGVSKLKILATSKPVRALRLASLMPVALKKFLPKLIALHPAMHPDRQDLLPLGIAAKLFHHMPKPQRGFLVLALAALAVMMLTDLASTQPALSWHMTLQLALVFLPLLTLTCEGLPQLADHPRLFLWLPATATLSALLLSAELYAGSPLLHSVRGAYADPAGYNRGASYLVILSLPVMAGLWVAGRKLWLIPLITALILLGGLTESRAAKLALVLALAVTGGAFLLPLATRRVMSVLPFLALLWPFAVRSVFTTHFAWLEKLPPSWRARMEIWDYLSYRLTERPVLGWGLNSAHTLDYRRPHGGLYTITTFAASHPHNVVMQLWVEMGVPGVMLGLGFALYTLGRIGRLNARLQPFALGAWMAALVLCCVAYNFWTDSMFAAFALTGFAFRILEQRLTPAAA